MSIQDVKNKYIDYLDKFQVFEREDTIHVSLVVIKDKFRGKGLGKAIFKEINNYADQVEKVITLTPSDDWGVSKDKLIKFYKNLGFVLNKGRNKNYEYNELMYRNPKNNIMEAVMDTNRFKELAGISTKQNNASVDVLTEQKENDAQNVVRKLFSLNNLRDVLLQAPSKNINSAEDKKRMEEAEKKLMDALLETYQKGLEDGMNLK